MELRVPMVLDQKPFDGLGAEFEEDSDVSVFLPHGLTLREVRALVQFLLLQNRGDLRDGLLSDLVDDANFPPDLLEEAFRRGDIGCRVAVCLKGDLPPHVEALCADSEEEEVRAHYTARKVVCATQTGDS